MNLYMPPDNSSFTDLLAFAAARLDAAEFQLAAGDVEGAAGELRAGAEALSAAGVFALNTISPADSAHLDTTTATIIRRLAQDAELLPDSATLLRTLAPELKEYLPGSSADLSAGELITAVQNIYSAEPADKPAGRDTFSLIEMITSFIRGQQTLQTMVFDTDGIYDSFADLAAPYLITGASLLSRTADKETGQDDRILKMLHGPAKRLARLFYALCTSSFATGLLLILIRRVVTVRRGPAAMTDNAAFAFSLISLTAANIPMIISGLRAALTEIAALHALATAPQAGEARN